VLIAFFALGKIALFFIGSDVGKRISTIAWC
jgi:hypothetical protein